MDIKKIIYFSLSALVLVFIGIILADDEKPAEIPAVVTFPAASAYTVSAVSEAVSTACDESEILTDVSVSESEKETVSEITSVSSDETEFSESIQDISFPINLNTASRDELMLIDGIGESTADKIIEYRERNGGFDSVSRLIEINGIGEAKLEKFRSFLYVEGDTDFIDEPQNNDNNYQEDYNIPDDNSHDDNNNDDIPHEEQTQPPVEETTPEDTEIPMVELNSATAEDFMKLPGIDEEMAYKIVEFREKIQYFSHPYELLYIDGMTEKMLSGAIDYMYIEGKEDIIY